MISSVRTSVAFRLIGESRFGAQCAEIFARAGIEVSELPLSEPVALSASSEAILALLDCPLPESAGLPAQIDWILKKVGPVRGHLAELRRLGCRQELYCGLFLRDSNAMVGIAQDKLSSIASHGLSLILDVYNEDESA
jgi:hypothetical protein